MVEQATATRFLESELPLIPADSCCYQVIPVPYEATVSYGGGTAGGPQAILDASCQLELLTHDGTPAHADIYTWPAVKCTEEAETVLAHIEAAVEKALTAGPQGELPSLQNHHKQNKIATAPTVPVVLGGEHSVTLGILRALKKRYGHFGIIHFDAHADLRDSYQGSPYSHACVMHRAVEELDLELFQIGVRSLCLEEQLFRKTAHIGHCDAQKLQCPLLWSKLDTKEITTLLDIPRSFPTNIFLSFDIDALDCSLMPATGTPEPGGLFWWDAVNLIRQTLTGKLLLGFDVVELAPIPTMHAPNYVTARLVYEIMAMPGK